MREIKFRAWDGKYMIDSSYGDWVSFDGVTFTEAEKGYDTPHIEIEKARNYILMQFTGLKDKNGKDIYEGDIIRAYQSDGSQVLHSISYSNEEARFIVSCIGYGNLSGGFDKRWIEEFGKEIIGNIYENPELLTP